MTTAVITGVSSGLGKAMAEYFTKQGVTVYGICRSAPELPPGAEWIRADITKAEDRRMIRQTLEEKGVKPDILINNAGKGIYATWEEMPESDLREVMELDFFAPVALTKELLPLLAETEGTVINVSSVAGRIWVPCMGGYCAAKAAVAMFSNSLRPEIAKYGIRVLDVAHGPAAQDARPIRPAPKDIRHKVWQKPYSVRGGKRKNGSPTPAVLRLQCGR